MSRLLAVLAGTAAAVFAQSGPILNESKRRFYEETTDVNAVPGRSTQEETELLGPRTVVNGMTVRLAPIVENAFGAVRTSLEDTWTTVESYVNDSKNTIYEKDRQVSSTIRSLHHRSEDLMPNSIYIAIAALTGQIIARNRNIVVRAFLPLGLGIGAFQYFLPKTFAHTASFLWKAEQKALPGLASTQGAAVEQAEKLVQSIEQTAVKGKESYINGVESVKNKVFRFTGLNLNEDVTDK